MNKVKYFWVARVLKLFLQFGLVFSVIIFVVNVSADLFQFKRYVIYKNIEFGNREEGYKVQTRLSLNIPDTVINYRNGQERIYNKYKGSPVLKRMPRDNNREKTEVVVNKFRPFNQQGITVSNKVVINEPVDVYVNSIHKKHKIFWSIANQLDVLFSIAFFLLLIKLLNRYMDRMMFEQRTFGLIAGFGWLIIFRQILAFVFAIINGKIIGNTQLNTLDVLNDKSYSFYTVYMNFYEAFSFSKIGVGVLILLIAYVLKEAILVKKENDLTI